MARTPDPSEAEFVRRVREPRKQSAEPGRHAARRAAMMLLYQVDLVTNDDVEDAITRFGESHEGGMPSYGAELVRGVVGVRGELDEQIGANLTDWSVDRLGAVERAVLRIAMHELRTGDVPSAIVIDEAVELAKRYSSPDASKLVNGVLGGWVRANPSEERT